jgi:hypothetical protein
MNLKYQQKETYRKISDEMEGLFGDIHQGFQLGLILERMMIKKSC